MDVARLVKLVRQHEFLYDVTNRDYKNIRLKAVVWDNIGKELNDTGENAKLKWKTVRDGYIKYRKQAYQGNGKKAIDYVWSSQLKFLDKYNVSRKPRTRGPIGGVPTPFESEQCEDSQDQVEATPLPHSPTQLMSFGMLMSPADVSQQPYHIEPLQSEHCEPRKTQKFEIYDATDHLFLSYSQTFKKFSPREQALLKIDLAKLFANAELRELYGGEEPAQTSNAVKRECDNPEESDDPLGGMLVKRPRNT